MNENCIHCGAFIPWKDLRRHSRRCVLGNKYAVSEVSFFVLLCMFFYCRQQKTSGNSSDSDFLDDPPRSNKIIYVPSDSETDTVSFKR